MDIDTVVSKVKTALGDRRVQIALVCVAVLGVLLVATRGCNAETAQAPSENLSVNETEVASTGEEQDGGPAAQEALTGALQAPEAELVEFTVEALEEPQEASYEVVAPSPESAD